MGSAASRTTAGRVATKDSSAKNDKKDDIKHFSNVAGEVMNDLNRTKVFDTEETFQSIQQLIDVNDRLRDKRLGDLRKICTILINKGLLELFIRLWDYCYVDTKELYSSADGIEWINLYTIKVLFQNYADTCPELSTACYENDQVIERLVREFTIPELDVQFHGQDRVRRMVVSNLGLLHNLLRRNIHNRNHLRKYGGIERILAYEKSEYSLVVTFVFIVLAFCINEDENKHIMAGRKVINFIKNLLEAAVEASDHNTPTFVSFSAEEIVEALSKLASNDENKKTIVDEGVLPLLTKLLDPETSSKSEHLQALNCIWSLAFHAENKDKIKEEHCLLDGVRKVRSMFKSNENINKACSGIMFVLNLEQPTEEASEIPKSGKKHLMISYNWEVQDTMLQLHDYLEQNGYSTWMDVEKMQGSTLSAMGYAVDNAALIIVALTESYKESNSCRTEGDYAYEKGIPMLPLILQNDYKADGWLGAWVGSKLYIDLSPAATHANREANFAKITKQIEAMGITMAGEEQTDGNPVAAKQVLRQPARGITSGMDNAGASLVKATLSCKGWTVDEVRNWCRANGVKDKKVLNKCDGSVLEQLCKLLVRSPDTYYLVLRQDMHLSWEEMLHFTDAVETLS